MQSHSNNMETLRRSFRKSFRKVRGAGKKTSQPESTYASDEYQEGLSQFQVKNRRRESVRVKKLSGGRAGLEREIKKKISLEDNGICFNSSHLLTHSR